MSLRRDYSYEESVFVRAPSPTSVAPAGTTISDQLGLPNESPAKPYVRFSPQHPTPQSVGNVVDDVFDGYDATAMYVRETPIIDTGGMMSDALAKAKLKANQAVLKGKELAGKAAAKSKELAGKAATKAKAAAAAASERMSGTEADDEDCDCVENGKPACCDDDEKKKEK